jgi:hypothetical protein
LLLSSNSLEAPTFPSKGMTSFKDKLTKESLYKDTDFFVAEDGDCPYDAGNFHTGS